jgi:hypothetical protein
MWSQRYIQTQQISQDMDNFIFAVLLKLQKKKKPENPPNQGRTAEVMQLLHETL